MVVRHPAVGEKGRFERFSEAASNFTSSLVFYALCLVLVAFFVAAHAAGLSVAWMLLAGDLMTSVTLLLLALLKNAERRAEHAIQRKLDAIAAALLEQDQGEARKAQENLRRAIRMEEEV
ncbi:low affinity iron permease family protein [Streptomyces sp. NPDC004393]|uniref:low affinity iron permease family protein n=1 Tax=Streptomyces sp. NPDC004533 TaxID=3154278 RepID=UPI0033ADF4DA